MCVKCGVQVAERVEAGLPKKNWFERHLNWTVAIASCITVLIEYIILFEVVPSSTSASNFEILSILFVWFIAFLAYPIIMLVVGSWGLHQKGRSLWWLFLVVPFGWIPYVCLKNKKCVKCGMQVAERVEAGLPKKNWFERHLNWTVAIASCITFLITVLIEYIIIFEDVPSPISASNTTIMVMLFVWFIAFVAYPIIMLVVGSWGLRQKGRSLWWLFLVVPFSWIPYVCLKNKKC
jgi:uncharacterized membrane protein YhaH (DUF805 family)